MQSTKKLRTNTLNNSVSTSQGDPCAEAQVGETSCTTEQEKSNTVQNHKIDACESRRCRINDGGKQKHEEHIADRGNISMSLHSLVLLPRLVLKAMKIPDAEVAVDKEWDQFFNFSSLARVQSKKQK